MNRLKDKGISAYLGLCLAFFAHCKRSASDAGSSVMPEAGATAAPARGERVVVETVAAEFHEARMLSLDGQNARVQMIPSGETKSVELGDVYRVGAPSRPLLSGDRAICNLEAAWVACRVVSTFAGRYGVESADGAHGEIDAIAVIVPTAVTELNLKRRFERARDRDEFAQGLAKSRDPIPPSGWKPSPEERVLAHLEHGWFVGSIHELGKKELRIAWPESDRVSEVLREHVIPMPPYSVTLHKGDYVLCRPASLAAPWLGMRVESADDTRISVRDVNGDKRDVSLQDLVPLGK